MALGSALGGIIGSAIGWAIGWVIDWFITELYSNNPDPIGSGAIAFTWQNKWFGAHPSKKIIISNSKEYIQIRYKIMYFRSDVQLKKKQNYFDLETYR